MVHPKLAGTLGRAKPGKRDTLLFAVLLAAAYLLFAHPDILETARHGYILLNSIRDGQFFDFYENTLTRVYGYDYSNAAHYNIVIYLLYALWELPLYLCEALTGWAFSDTALALWCKAIGVGFYIGSGFLVQAIAKRMDCDETVTAWMPLAFWLNPISFFTVVIMGQYDSICLFFLLLGLLYYLDGKLWRFSLIMGVGLVCKFFPVFLLLPLLLLAEKRPLRVVAYAAASLWLYLPTTLLFYGRTGDAAYFNSLMTERLFANSFHGGVTDASCFGVAMALICVAAWLYRPRTERARRKAVLYIGLAVFGTLFLFVLWHPQWLLLLVPFVLLTTACAAGEGRVLQVVDVILACGFLLLSFQVFPGQLEGDLLDLGVLRFWMGTPYSLVAQEGRRFVAFYIGLLSYAAKLIPLCFYGALFAELIFKLPLPGGTVAAQLANEDDKPQGALRLYVWGGFAVGIAAVWLLPTLFAYCKTLGVL